jgi:hypothetical protein
MRCQAVAQLDSMQRNSCVFYLYLISTYNKNKRTQRARVLVRLVFELEQVMLEMGRS